MQRTGINLPHSQNDSPRGRLVPVVESVHSHLILDAFDGLERDHASSLACAPHIRHHQRQGVQLSALINGQDRIEITSHGIESDRSGTGCDPRPPEGPPAIISRVIGFARFPCGLGIVSDEGVGLSGHEEPICELIVRPRRKRVRLKKAQNNVPGGDDTFDRPIAIHRDLVGLSRNCREHHGTPDRGVQRIGVVVLRDQGQ